MKVINALMMTDLCYQTNDEDIRSIHYTNDLAKYLQHDSHLFGCSGEFQKPKFKNQESLEISE